MRSPSPDQYFIGRMFRRQYFPALIAAVVLSLGDVADGLVLGNSVGYIGLAAIALTMPVCQVFNVIMNGLGIGGSVLFSRQMAQGRRKEALAGFQGIACTAVLAGLVTAVFGVLLIRPLLGLLGTHPEDGELFHASSIYLSILMAGAPALFLNYVLNYYMKNDDLEKKASVAFTAGNIVDISLNVVLVLVLRIGVAGASIATVAGQTVGMTLSLIFIARHHGALKLRPLKPDFSETLSSFGNGFTSSIEFLYSMFFMLIANRLLLRTSGGIGVAVFDVVLSVSYFVINISDAAAKSSLPVISTYYGEYNEHGTRLALASGLRYALVSGAALAAAVFFFPGAILGFFGLSEAEILETGGYALKSYAPSIPMAAACAMLLNFYEARQQEKDTLLLSTLRGLLPIGFALLFQWAAPEKFFFLYLLTEAVTLAVFGIYKRLAPRAPFDRERVFRKTIYSKGTEISETTEQIEAFCERWEIPARQQYIAQMAVEELCVATLDNGFSGKEDGFFQITLAVQEEGSLEVHIRDNADSFNPFAMEMNSSAADDDADLAALGVVTIKKKAKGFSYRHYQGFNTVILRL